MGGRRGGAGGNGDSECGLQGGWRVGVKRLGFCDRAQGPTLWSINICFKIICVEKHQEGGRF